MHSDSRIQSATTSVLSRGASEVGSVWLPKGYRFERRVGPATEFVDNAYHTVLATDLATEQPVLFRMVSETLFDADGIFRFECHLKSLSQVQTARFQNSLSWGVENGFVWSAHDFISTANGIVHFASQKEDNPPTSLFAVGGAVQVLDIGISILQKLEEIHQKGCLQQDMRLSQILFDGEVASLICPSPMMFVKSESRPEEWSMSFAQVASPELVGAIDHDIGISSDIYSAGILLYWLVSGQLPFTGSLMGDVLLQHLTAKPDYTLLGKAPAPLIRVIQKMLLKEPRDRYQSAFAASRDLSQVRDIVTGQCSESQFVVGRFDKRETLTDPSFVGRHSELAKLEATISQTQMGLGQSVIVECPSGVGKTRLIVESLRFAKERGFEIFRGRGFDRVAQQPGGPVMHIVQQILSRPYLHPRLRDVLNSSRVLIGSVLPKFAIKIGLFEDWPDLKRQTVLHGDANVHPFADSGQHRVIAAFCKILAAVASADRPTLIWLDDCQWLDLQTVEVFRELLEMAPTCTCVILSMRNDETVAKQLLGEITPNAFIEPQPLSDLEINALIESMAGALPEEAVHVSTGLSSGNPFMATAILRGMVETGALDFQDGRWKIDSAKLSNVKTCSSAAEALLIRLENVSSELLELLSVASLIGREFKTSTVTEVCDLPFARARDCLKQAREQRLIWATPDGTLTFVHDKIRETLIGRLQPSNRRDIHYRLAKSFSASGSANSGDIAFHFDAADRCDEGFQYAMKAAEKALAAFSLGTVVQMLKIARRGVAQDDTSSIHNIESQLAHTLMLDGKYEAAERWFKTASVTASSSLEKAKIEEYSGELAFKRGMKTEAVGFLERALNAVGGRTPRSKTGCLLELVGAICIQAAHTLFPSWFIGTKKDEASEIQRLRWRIYSRLAHGYWYTREKPIVVLTHLKYMNEAERYPATPELAQAWSEHAPGMSLIPCASRGSRYALKSLELRKEQNDLWGQGQSYGFYSLLSYACSKFDDCLSQAIQAESILLKTGDYWEVNIARYHVAAAMFRKGQLRDAVQYCQQTYEAALKIGDYQSTGNIMEVWARASQGKLALSTIELEESRNVADSQRASQLLLAKGIHAIAKKRYLEAVQHIEDGIKTATKAQILNAYTVPCYPWLATALRLAWESQHPTSQRVGNQDSRRLFCAAKKALKHSRRFKNELPHALREMGLAQLKMGREKKARLAIEESIAVAKSQGARYEAALSRVAYGEHGVSFGWQHHNEIFTVGKLELAEFKEELRDNQGHDSISLLDRFDSLLDAGQQIASSVDQDDIFQKTLAAGVHLLRGSSTMILWCKHVDSAATKEPAWEVRAQQGVGNEPFLMELVLSAVQKGTAVAQDKTIGPNGDFQHASLCSPIDVRGKTVACLYVTNQFVNGLYGASEIRIADYLTSASGAALEKADGFRQLEELNADLEERVVDRTRIIEARSQELELIAHELWQTKEKLELARDEAQEADRTKSQFLARMSHEIRTPLSAVIGFTDLILRGTIKSPIELRKRLETIEGSGKHLLELVNDLLDLSKIESGTLEVDRIPCVPTLIIHEAIDALQSRAIENKNVLSLNFEGYIPKTIHSDRTRLKQIVTNVVGNAIKFTSQGSVTATVRYRDRGDGGLLEIDVVDTGIGMDKDQLIKIFDPFVQADASVTRNFGGTGLGLAISQQLVSALDGTITASSRPNVGTTFTIAFQIASNENFAMLDSNQIQTLIETPDAQHWLKADLTGVSVFYADDAETNRELIRLLLTQYGAVVHTAENGAVALRRLTDSQHPEFCDDVAVVLMDMQMPVMDGYTATQRLRDGGFDKPIIAFTANNMTGDREKCIAAGCTDFLSKPLDTNLLLEKVASICGVDTTRHIRAVEEFSVFPDEVRQSINCEIDALEPMMQTFAHEFIPKLNRRLHEFDTSIECRDAHQLHQLAHWAKGTGGTVGLANLADLATSIDEAAMNEQWHEIDTYYTEMRDYLAKYALS